MAASTPQTCAWFMISPGLTGQALYDIEHIGSIDIAVAQQLCGAAYTKAIQQGLKPMTQTEAQSAADQSNTQASPALQSGPTVPDLSTMENFFSALSQKSTWIRIGEAVIGAGVLFIGLNAMFRSTQAGQAVADTAKKASSAAVGTAVGFAAPEAYSAAKSARAIRSARVATARHTATAAGHRATTAGINTYVAAKKAARS